MIEETATVVALGPGIAWVEATRRSACSACGQGASCGTGRLAQVFGARSNRLAVADPLGLALGERVAIGIPDGLLVRASLAAYLLPLVGLVAGAGLAEWAGRSEPLVALAGLLGLAAGLLLTGLLTGGAQGRARYRPLILRRLSESQSVRFEPRLAVSLDRSTKPR
jgi:sigma-E factor negative regulatory protein RseC